MVGAAGSESYVWFIDNDYDMLYNYSLPLSDSTYLYTEMYLPTSFSTYDFAHEGAANETGDFWLATDHYDSPIRSYDDSGDLMYASDVLPSVRGMAYSSSGSHRYLWVSNPDDNMIYQLDLDPVGVEAPQTGPVEPVTLVCSENPFHGSVSFSGTGFGPNAVIEIYDLAGRRVLEADFRGSFVWNGRAEDGEAVPSGLYYARVRDRAGRTEKASVVRL